MICNPSPDVNYWTGEFSAHDIHRLCRTNLDTYKIILHPVAN